MGASEIPSEIAVEGQRPLKAKSEVREFLATAEAAVLIVDNYVGPGTLDCIVDVSQPVRILTGSRDESMGSGFDRALADSASEGLTVEVRLHPKLHDRYLLFNDRCWLVGSSLKDDGRKHLSIVECVDSKAAIASDVEAKWQEATPYTP